MGERDQRRSRPDRDGEGRPGDRVAAEGSSAGMPDRERLPTKDSGRAGGEGLRIRLHDDAEACVERASVKDDAAPAPVGLEQRAVTEPGDGRFVVERLLIDPVAMLGGPVEIRLLARLHGFGEDSLDRGADRAAAGADLFAAGRWPRGRSRPRNSGCSPRRSGAHDRLRGTWRITETGTGDHDDRDHDEPAFSAFDQPDVGSAFRFEGVASPNCAYSQTDVGFAVHGFDEGTEGWGRGLGRGRRGGLSTARRCSASIRTSNGRYGGAARAGAATSPPTRATRDGASGIRVVVDDSSRACAALGTTMRVATEGTPASARRIVQDVTRAAAEVPIPTRARQAGSRAALGVV